MSESVAIVVGAGGELGRATAEILAGAGHLVVGVDRSQRKLKELSDGIRREAGDATDPAAAKALIDRIADEVGPPEVLVNTIGMFRLGEAVTATPEDLTVLMDVNLGAALWLSQAVVPYMRQRGKGSIVHVSARPATDPAADMALQPQQGGTQPPRPHSRPGTAPARHQGQRGRAAAYRHGRQPGHVPRRAAGTRRAAGSDRERHRLPRRRPRRTR